MISSHLEFDKEAISDGFMAHFLVFLVEGGGVILESLASVVLMDLVI